MVQGRVKMANSPPVAQGMGVSGQPGGTVLGILLGCAISRQPQLIQVSDF